MITLCSELYTTIIQITFPTNLIYIIKTPIITYRPSIPKVQQNISIIKIYMITQPKPKSIPLFLFFLLLSITLTSLNLYLHYVQPLPQTRSFVDRQLYTTNEIRTDNVQTYCSSESYTFTDEQKATNDGYMSTMATYFSGNTTKIIGYMINVDFVGLQTQSQTIGWGYILYAGPFLLGLVVLLFMWPFILCCCICPASCPLSCCRKSPKEMYGNCQLLTPLLITGFLMFVCIATSIPSMTRANPYFQKLECSSSMFLDNILNGNVTEDGESFFVGMTTMVQQLNFLKANLTLIKSQIQQLDGSPGTQMETANNYAIDALSTITTMPNGIDTNQLSLSYSYPLHDTTNNTGTLNSKFVDVLGTYITSDTLTHTLYSTVDAVKDSLESIKNSSAEISPQLTSSGIGANIDTVIEVIDPLIDVIKSTDTLLGTILAISSSIDSYFDQYAIAFYGCVLGLSLLVVIGIVLIKCFKVLCCRFLMYFACFFLFFVCLVGLVLSSALSLSLPIMYYSCDYITTSFESGDNFKAMVEQVGGSEYEDFGNYFSVCLAGENGDIMKQMNADLNAQLDHLTTAIFDTVKYNFTNQNDVINTAFNSVENSINNYGTGKIPDFSTTSTYGAGQISYFNRISEKTVYESSCPPGSYSVFYTDVWVPSTSQQFTDEVSCQSKVTIDTTQCPAGMDTGCPFSRCLDSFDFLVTYNNTGQLEADINSRYGTTCTAFNDHMKSFYTRYVTVIDDNIGNTNDDHADTNKVSGRFMESKNKTDILTNYMDSTLKPLFTSISNELQNSTDSITNTEEGLLAGMNCRLMGEDVVRMSNSICVSMFNALFFTFVTTGLISFALLFSLCCIVCTGVQHYKDSIKRRAKDKFDEPKLRSKDDTMSIIEL